jgi:hypothetical protein
LSFIMLAYIRYLFWHLFLGVVSVVVPLMLAVLPYARSRGFDSRSRLLFGFIRYNIAVLTQQNPHQGAMVYWLANVFVLNAHIAPLQVTLSQTNKLKFTPGMKGNATNPILKRI